MNYNNWESLGLVFSLEKDFQINDIHNSHTQCPFYLNLENEERIYFSSRDLRNISRIYYVKIKIRDQSINLVNNEIYGPIVSEGNAKEFDSEGAMISWIHKFRNNYMPVEGALASDITIGHLYGGTASLESVLAGVPSVLLNKKNSGFDLGVNINKADEEKVCFSDISKVLEKVESILNSKELDVDFYTFSLYKTYGPHLALLYGKEEILKNLPNQNHEFLKGQYPYTINPGGPNHEELVSLIGIFEYLMKLYDHHFNDNSLPVRKKINQINKLISNHEEEIANSVLNYLNKRDDLNLIGKNKIINQNRAPTISFTSNKISSKKFAEKLVLNKIATRNDNFYAWRCLEALGISTNDGVIRLSMVHYNTLADTNKIIKTLKLI